MGLAERLGLLKTSKMFKIGAILSFAAAGCFALSQLWLLGSLGFYVPIESQNQQFLDEVRATEGYQVYFDGEKAKLDDMLAAKELTVENYQMQFDELKDKAVLSYIAEFGSDEQKDRRDYFEQKKTTLDKVAYSIGGSLGALSVIGGCAGVGLMFLGENKESEYSKETTKMAEYFGEDEEVLPDIYENEESDEK